MQTRNVFFCFVILMTSVIGSPTFAHKLSLFVSAAGEQITGKVFFTGGNPARGVEISVIGEKGEIISRLTSDENGAFKYQATRRERYEFVADSGDGHVARFVLKTDELPETLSSGPNDIANVSDGNAGAQSLLSHSPTQEQIEQTVARQIRPLREEILVLRDQIRFRDILGGIGYIVGIAGLLAWFDARRRKKTP